MLIVIGIHRASCLSSGEWAECCPLEIRANNRIFGLGVLTRSDQRRPCADRQGAPVREVGAGQPPVVTAKTCIALVPLDTPRLMSGRVIILIVLPAWSFTVAMYRWTVWFCRPFRLLM